MKPCPKAVLWKPLIVAFTGFAGGWLMRVLLAVETAPVGKQSTVTVIQENGSGPKVHVGKQLSPLESSLTARLSFRKEWLQYFNFSPLFISDRFLLQEEVAELFMLDKEKASAVEAVVDNYCNELRNTDISQLKVLEQTGEITRLVVPAYPEKAQEFYANYLAKLGQIVGRQNAQGIAALLQQDFKKYSLDCGFSPKEITVQSLEDGRVIVDYKAGSFSGKVGGGPGGRPGDINSVPLTLRHLVKMEVADPTPK